MTPKMLPRLAIAATLLTAAPALASADSQRKGGPLIKDGTSKTLMFGDAPSRSAGHRAIKHKSRPILQNNSSQQFGAGRQAGPAQPSGSYLGRNEKWLR